MLAFGLLKQNTFLADFTLRPVNPAKPLWCSKNSSELFDILHHTNLGLWPRQSSPLTPLVASLGFYNMVFHDLGWLYAQIIMLNEESFQIHNLTKCRASSWKLCKFWRGTTVWNCTVLQLSTSQCNPFIGPQLCAVCLKLQAGLRHLLTLAN